MGKWLMFMSGTSFALIAATFAADLDTDSWIIAILAVSGVGNLLLGAVIK